MSTTRDSIEQWSTEAGRSLAPFVARYGERKEGEPERLDKALLVQRKANAFDLLRDLHDLWLLVNESLISVDVLEQAAHALRDQALLQATQQIRSSNKLPRRLAAHPHPPGSAAGAGGALLTGPKPAPCAWRAAALRADALRKLPPPR
jgi:hypothetical protein